MCTELGSIHANDTWTLEALPLGTKPISCQWIFKLKLNIAGSPPIKKARLVAMGNQQKDGIDYLENFAPVIKWTTICAVITLIAMFHWTIHHMDVRTAFLNDNLKEKVYMRQPEVLPNLEKSIYTAGFSNPFTAYGRALAHGTSALTVFGLGLGIRV
jgi:hypothetical protein